MGSNHDEDRTVREDPERSGDHRASVRWVQYEAPVFVRVEPYEDGWGTELGPGFGTDR